jgi:hypothetical protein
MKQVNNISNWQTLGLPGFWAHHQQKNGASLKFVYKTKHLMIFIDEHCKLITAMLSGDFNKI